MLTLWLKNVFSEILNIFQIVYCYNVKVLS